MENITGKMAIFIEVVGETICLMDMESCSIQMVEFLKVSSKQI
jgi:hypothetical protein